MSIAYSADVVFTGTERLNNAAVIVNNNKIADVIPVHEMPSEVKVIKHGAILAASFIDIQIYGAASRLFAVYPDYTTLEKMNEHCLSGGTKHFLPTLATNSADIFRKGIDAIRNYWNKGGSGVIGLHIEGPWINPKKKGAHIESFIHSPHLEEVSDLISYGESVIKIITLAPEVCSGEVINFIQRKGILVSAGHSNGTFEEINKAFSGGITLATHLFNAMSSIHHRQPGFPVAVLLHPSVMASIVADGYHVDFDMIRLAWKLMGNRLFLITDAVTETKEGLYPHTLVGEKYVSNGILSGSALTLLKAVKNCVEKCAIPLEEALRMASLHPAKALGIDGQTGKIARGYAADLVMIDAALEKAECL
jgi:N-acetylglucosamine-6-phosphate deacetylase